MVATKSTVEKDNRWDWALETGHDSSQRNTHRHRGHDG